MSIATFVEPAGPVVCPGAGALLAAVEAIWVDGGDEGDVRRVHQIGDLGVPEKTAALKSALKYIRSLPEEPHLAWVGVTFGDFPPELIFCAIGLKF